MSDRTSIDWELIKIHPGPYDLFKHLDRWFDNNETLIRIYNGVPRMGLPNWERMRARQRRLDKGKDSGWRVHTQRRLCALLVATRGLADRLWDLDYDSWLLRNCRPSGGEWKGSRYETGPTGKSCRNKACPWCWLRMYAFLRQMCTSAGIVVHPNQKYAVNAIGLGPEVGCKIYQSLDDGLYTDQVQRFKDDVDKDFRKSAGTSSKKVLKVACPTHNFKDGWGIRIAYIYEANMSMSGGQLAGIQTAVFDKLKVDIALGKVFPFPASFLDDRIDIRIVRNILTGFADTRSFTTIG